MVELYAVHAIWLREAKVFLREKERIASSILSPLLWLFIFGSGMGESISGDYRAFIFPGILCMSVLFVSMFYGLYIIWDRRLDFLKEVLVAPVSRSSIFFGKVLGGVTDAMLHALFLLFIGAVFVIPISPSAFLLSLVFLFMIAFAMTGLGLIIGANMKSQEGFSLVVNFVMWPMFFFSGALFNISNLPSFLKPISSINPLTYGVDALRVILLGSGSFPLIFDATVIFLFIIITSVIGVFSFGSLQQAK
ncbi:MAG: ABC transporter permease [Candidatus Micrarchaeia archaeon]